MRRALTALLISAFAAAPLAAQFEGTINMKLSNYDGANVDGMTVKIVVKGDKQATIMKMPASAGPMAGLEMRSILDPKTNTVTTLVPLPPSMSAMAGMAGAKGFKMVTDLSKIGESTQSDSKAQIKKLGTSEKVAGFDCDDYEITAANGDISRACITQSLGRFVFPQGSGGMGRGASAPPAWAKAFGNRAAFPLKVVTGDGKVAVEVISVDKGAVPASAFEIPDGYTDMGAMGRGRGGI
jgi:hypothetical protein